MTYNHEKEVRRFFAACEKSDPENYQKVKDKFPTVSWRRWNYSKKYEQSVGLLGLQPANLSIEVAYDLGYESVHLKEED